MLIQIILLHGFDVCISIVRLNRYELIQIILLHGFNVCISIVRSNWFVINAVVVRFRKADKAAAAAKERPGRQLALEGHQHGHEHRLLRQVIPRHRMRQVHQGEQPRRLTSAM